MNYLPTSGPLGNGDSRGLGPIQATVTFTDGHTEHLTLDWLDDTCAQINHGC